MSHNSLVNKFITSLSFCQSPDPGVLKTGSSQNTGWLRLAVKLIERDPIYGAYIELFE